MQLLPRMRCLHCLDSRGACLEGVFRIKGKLKASMHAAVLLWLCWSIATARAACNAADPVFEEAQWEENACSCWACA